MPAAPSEACEIVIVDSMVALLYCLSVPISSRSDTTGVDSLPYPVEGLGGSESLSKAMGELVEDVELSSSAWVVGDETPSLRPAPPALLFTLALEGLTSALVTIIPSTALLLLMAALAVTGRSFRTFSFMLSRIEAFMFSRDVIAPGRTATGTWLAAALSL